MHYPKILRLYRYLMSFSRTIDRLGGHREQDPPGLRSRSHRGAANALQIGDRKRITTLTLSTFDPWLTFPHIVRSSGRANFKAPKVPDHLIPTTSSLSASNFLSPGPASSRYRPHDRRHCHHQSKVVFRTRRKLHCVANCSEPENPTDCSSRSPSPQAVGD